MVQPAEMPEGATPVEKIAQAVQKFANEVAGEPVLVDVAVLVWEEVTYGDDGKVLRETHYSQVTNHFGIASTIGLLEATKHQLMGELHMIRHNEGED